MGSLFGRAALRALLCGPRIPGLLVRPRSGGPSWPQERTLVAVKPDGVQRRLVGTVIERFERRGFKLVGMKMLQAPESILAEHYRDLQRKPFYPALISYMSSGPVVAMVQQGRGNGLGVWGVLPKQKKGVGLSPWHLGSPDFCPTFISVLQVWEGHNVIRISRTMIGHTDSTEAAPGTIRGDFSIHISRNIIHASDSVEGAQREIQLWFKSSELLNWADDGHPSSCCPA
ncbi:Nucleoside diphosphate kinase, mitochondrial [Cricetulus griseus]|uniref:Nucleoside diphosphate kinase n=1 Tax=Cricetulus griseus TaxID=10029 RepID=G3HBS8_CRIGR|nr:Nucleoside diphosphate kinase, mitochondrial [Cricetulus griseus]